MNTFQYGAASGEITTIRNTIAERAKPLDIFYKKNKETLIQQEGLLKQIPEVQSKVSQITPKVIFGENSIGLNVQDKINGNYTITSYSEPKTGKILYESFTRSAKPKTYIVDSEFTRESHFDYE